MAPTRPVDGASIATVWGQEVHDATFAPKGSIVHGGSITLLATVGSYRTLPLTVADDDPGGWLDDVHYRLEVPPDAGGVYALFARLNTVDGDDGDQVRAVIRLNGAAIAGDSAVSNGSGNVPFGVSGVAVLSPGDQLLIAATKIDAGATPDMTVFSFAAIRIGEEMGG